jgi:drug/metabolite transporter (DMT)-like permease
MKPKIWLALASLYIAWGSTYLAIRYAVESIPPFFMSGMRFLVAGLVLYTWRRLAGDPAPTRAQWKNAGIIGMFLLVGGIGGVSLAEQSVPSGIVALIVAAIPLWVVLLESILHRQLPSGSTILSIMVGMLGIVLLSPIYTPEQG